MYSRGTSDYLFLGKMIVLWKRSSGKLEWADSMITVCGDNATSISIGGNVIYIVKNYSGTFENSDLI